MAIKRKEAITAAANELYDGNRAQARRAYQNAKAGLYNRGVYGRSNRQGAREMLMNSAKNAKGIINTPKKEDLILNDESASIPDWVEPEAPTTVLPPPPAPEAPIEVVESAPIEVVESTTPPPPRLSNEDIARQVIRGKWMNGAERVKRLTEAGYDPKVIQSIVNKLITTSKPTVTTTSKPTVTTTSKPTVTTVSKPTVTTVSKPTVKEPAIASTPSTQNERVVDDSLDVQNSEKELVNSPKTYPTTYWEYLNMEDKPEAMPWWWRIPDPPREKTAFERSLVSAAMSTPASSGRSVVRPHKTGGKLRRIK